MAEVAPATGRPPKPDEEQFKKDLAQAEKEYNASMVKYNAIKSKIDLAMPAKSKDQPSETQKRKQELLAEANEIRQKQAGGKNARTTKQDQIKRLDEQLRSRINEQKAAKAKVPYKNTEDLERRIAELRSEVDSGTMRLVDEKRHLTEIGNLTKLKKSFAQFDESQRQIDELKAKIKDIKDGMDDPEQKALSERYTAVQSELNGIRAESDEAFKNLSGLRDERSRLQAEQQEKFTAIRKIKDEYYTAKKANAQYEREARDRHREKIRQERERQALERKKADAERMLSEASDPAYLEEIRRANSLLRFLDPAHASTEKAPLMADSGLGAQAQRKVDGSGFEGMKIVKKEEEDYLPAVRKGKKGKKKADDSAAKAYNCPPSVMSDCAAMGIDPPMSAADVPAVIEKVREKLEFYRSDQQRQTEKNIAKAKKEIERLEKQDAANGDAKVEEVTAAVKEAEISEEKA